MTWPVMLAAAGTSGIEDGSLQLPTITTHKGYRGSLAKKVKRDAAADALPRAGDKGDFPAELVSAAQRFPNVPAGTPSFCSRSVRCGVNPTRRASFGGEAFQHYFLLFDLLAAG